MSNEFYCVDIRDDDTYFFKDKDKAFSFLWQKFLSVYGDLSNISINKAFDELNEYYAIQEFGCVNVYGFED